jgi:hypothetical protein
MSNAPGTPAPSAAPTKKPVRHRPSNTVSAVLARAEVIAAALPPLLSGIAEADAGAASPAIDAAWVAQLNGTIAATQAAQGEGASAKVGGMAATASEHEAAAALVALLTQVRQKVEIHSADDVAAQRAYGRGVKLSVRDVQGALAAAQAYLASWGGAWKGAAASAGVTQATMDQLTSLSSALSEGTVQQQAAKTAGSQGTLTRAGAVAALSSMCAFAVRVVTAAFGKGSRELATLTARVPLQGRGAARKAAAKAKKSASRARVAATKAASRAKQGARGKARAAKAKRAAVGVRKAAFLAAPKKAPKKAARAKKKAPAKKTKRKG